VRTFDAAWTKGAEAAAEDGRKPSLQEPIRRGPALVDDAIIRKHTKV
jgi:hypothetical protein